MHAKSLFPEQILFKVLFSYLLTTWDTIYLILFNILQNICGIYVWNKYSVDTAGQGS